MQLVAGTHYSLAFALAASPCSTPVLATLLGYVASSGDPVTGGALLLTYTSGYVAPLLVRTRGLFVTGFSPHARTSTLIFKIRLKSPTTMPFISLLEPPLTVRQKLSIDLIGACTLSVQTFPLVETKRTNEQTNERANQRRYKANGLCARAAATVTGSLQRIMSARAYTAWAGAVYSHHN